MLIRTCFLAVLIAFTGFSARAAVSIKKIGQSLVDAKALTIEGRYGLAINGQAFQQDAIASHRGWQYLGYYDEKRHVCVARRRLPAGKWEVLRLLDYKIHSNNAHNTISLGICPGDGTLHLSFDQHNDELRYRVSEKNVVTDPDKVVWEPDIFGKRRSCMEPDKIISICYPRFWQTPDGGLQFCYRSGGSGNGDRMLVDYDPKTGTWSGTRAIDSREGFFSDHRGESSSRSSYPNGYDYGPKGKLHATWVWRESGHGTNHDLCYAYSEDRGKTWLNNAGKPFKGPPRVDSPGLTVVSISRGHSLMNTHGQAIDSQGRVHVVMWHCTEESLEAAGAKFPQHGWGPPEARRYHHYWRDGEGVWQHRELPAEVGTRPKIFVDKKDNAYAIFSVGGDLIIASATAGSNWTDWKILHTEKGPFGKDMLGDLYRWKSEGILSIMVQGEPKESHLPTPLQVLDFKIVGN